MEVFTSSEEINESFDQLIKSLIDKIKNLYRKLHPGGCRIFSKGSECECFLCQCDNLKGKL